MREKGRGEEAKGKSERGGGSKRKKKQKKLLNGCGAFGIKEQCHS